MRPVSFSYIGSRRLLSFGAFVLDMKMHHEC